MKNLKLGISALALTVASTVFAQTTKSPWLIGVGTHGVNHMGVKGGFGDTMTNVDGVFNIDNYLVVPPLSKLTVARNLNKYLVLDWQTSVGNVDNKRFKMGKEFFLMTGLGLQFKANSLWNEDSWFDPYLRLGANYLRHDYSGLAFPRYDYADEAVRSSYNGDGDLKGKENHFTVNGGAGTNFWLTKNFGLGIQGDYVTTPGDKSNVANFWQASASILFRFGNTDTDGDGILNKDDECPNTPGLAQFNGCPDTDGDGIADKDDDCIDVAGPVENKGCPWPDTDRDGTLDKDDSCVNTAGPAANNGCPWPDTDGDNILDKDDKCPNTPGLAAYDGCPKPDSVIKDEAVVALRDIMFNYGKATINAQSNARLDAAAKIIKQSRNGKFLLVGHTDKKGSAKYNLNLSRKRAAAVVAALEARGVNANQLKSRGMGEAEATVSEKASNAERMIDRKVEVKVITDGWNSIPKRDY